MCKFTNRLFVLALMQCLALALANPIRNRSDLMELLYNDYGDYGYQVEEIHYDQRQKGEDNMRWRLDGFIFGLPGREDASWLETLSDLYINSPIPRKPTEPETSQNDQATTEMNLTKGTTARVINISTQKTEMESESRQQAAYDLSNTTRPKSQMVQLLKMFRHPQV